jgi:chromosomal replication initiation ATPase DnaA
MDGFAASNHQPQLRRRAEHQAVHLEGVSRAVARTFSVDPALFRAGRRASRSVTRARQTILYLAHVALGLSLAEVARLTGRDARTIATACRAIEDARAADEAFDAALTVLEKRTCGSKGSACS